jgi:RNA polymerase sigma factor (sigma-70 family)
MKSKRREDGAPTSCRAVAAVGPRHRLVLDALPIVARAARRARRRYGDLASYDDLCSIGKVALYDAAPRFRDGPGRSLGQFARSRVWGEMMNEVRRVLAEREARRESRWVADVEPWCGAAESDLGDAQEKLLAIVALREAVQDLPTDDRLLLDLLVSDDFDPSVAGAILGVARETVYRRLHRLRVLLGRRLKKAGVTRAPTPIDVAGAEAMAWCAR